MPPVASKALGGGGMAFDAPEIGIRPPPRQWTSCRRRDSQGGKGASLDPGTMTDPAPPGR